MKADAACEMSANRWSFCGMVFESPLFSQTNSTGSARSAAKLRLSQKTPESAAASPKYETEMRSSPLSFAASAEPTPSAIPPPTIADEPSIPFAGSTRCMEPPKPLAHPVVRP